MTRDDSHTDAVLPLKLGDRKEDAVFWLANAETSGDIAAQSS
jgi:hypothetical protein